MRQPLSPTVLLNAPHQSKSPRSTANQQQQQQQQQQEQQQQQLKQLQQLQQFQMMQQQVGSQAVPSAMPGSAHAQVLHEQQPALRPLGWGIPPQTQGQSLTDGFMRNAGAAKQAPLSTGAWNFGAPGAGFAAQQGVSAEDSCTSAAVSDPLIEAVRFCAQSKNQILNALKAKQTHHNVACQKCGMPGHRHSCPFTEETPATPTFTSSRVFAAHVPVPRRVRNLTHLNRSRHMKPGSTWKSLTHNFKRVRPQTHRIQLNSFIGGSDVGMSSKLSQAAPVGNGQATSLLQQFSLDMVKPLDCPAPDALGALPGSQPKLSGLGWEAAGAYKKVIPAAHHCQPLGTQSSSAQPLSSPPALPHPNLPDLSSSYNSVNPAFGAFDRSSRCTLGLLQGVWELSGQTGEQSAWQSSSHGGVSGHSLFRPIDLGFSAPQSLQPLPFAA